MCEEEENIIWELLLLSFFSFLFDFSSPLFFSISFSLNFTVFKFVFSFSSSFNSSLIVSLFLIFKILTFFPFKTLDLLLLLESDLFEEEEDSELSLFS